MASPALNEDFSEATGVSSLYIELAEISIGGNEKVTLLQLIPHHTSCADFYDPYRIPASRPFRLVSPSLLANSRMRS